MFSNRTPGSFEPNAWTARRTGMEREGRALLDLTALDPTRVGLSPLAEATTLLAGVGGCEHSPEALGLLSARAAVAGALAADGLHARPEHVALTPSTSESYAHLFRCFCDPGDGVAVPSPGYPLFEPIARAEGLVTRTYRLAWDGEWHLDRGSALEALEDARVFVTVEPAYPTGAVLGTADRDWLEGECAPRGVPLVADEVFRAPGTPGASWAASERRVLTAVLGGLSKTCGLPHLKLAWTVFAGPDRERDEALARFAWLEDLFLGVATPVQLALPGLLELRHSFRARVRARLAACDARLATFVAAHPELSATPAGDSWAQPLRLPGRRTGEAWAIAALEQGVALWPGEPFELAPGSHVVASRLVHPEDFARGLEVLGRALEAQPA